MMYGNRDFDAGMYGEKGYEEVRVRFSGGLSVSVRGPVTERIYRFTYESPEQIVDARDVASIVKTGLFRQVL